MTAIYVVAKFEEAKLARQVMDILEDQGHSITHDWTGESIEGLKGIDVMGVIQDAAVVDIEGVRAAEAVIVLHHDKLRNGLAEIGAALVMDKPVIVVGGHQGLDTPIFYWHPSVIHVPHIDGALALLKTLFPEETVEEAESTPQRLACICPQCDPSAPVIIDLRKIGRA